MPKADVIRQEYVFKKFSFNMVNLMTLTGTAHYYTPTEVNGRYGERQEGRARNDRQTLAWKNKHI